MKVIICGAGEVGKTLAQHLLKENNDIIYKSLNTFLDDQDGHKMLLDYLEHQ